ncbi:hypothetical protein IL992_02800 [Microbispora sp. NEAU-D428]|uniref:hypothetical protein n=1 Tax=Microbispora sitophila TaxID=2771537 RepID=UPI00186608F8|nr:hypothetical protein [Microbispora sitophila]MBE3008119.1 hypothetical protein [Microbispora sitophila]
MLRKIARRAAVVPLAFAALLGVQPANAASGGGCTGAYPISSCISISGSNAVGDFYMNAAPDISRYWYRLEVKTTNNGSKWTDYLRLDRMGRFGPIYQPIYTIPPTSGSAVTIVHVYTSGYVQHGTYTSPRVYN